LIKLFELRSSLNPATLSLSSVMIFFA